MSLMTSRNTGAFPDPGFDRQRGMKSGLNRPTVTFIARETTPARVRESETVIITDNSRL